MFTQNNINLYRVSDPEQYFYQGKTVFLHPWGRVLLKTSSRQTLLLGSIQNLKCCKCNLEPFSILDFTCSCGKSLLKSDFRVTVII